MPYLRFGRWSRDRTFQCVASIASAALSVGCATPSLTPRDRGALLINVTKSGDVSIDGQSAQSTTATMPNGERRTFELETIASLVKEAQARYTASGGPGLRPIYIDIARDAPTRSVDVLLMRLSYARPLTSIELGVGTTSVRAEPREPQSGARHILGAVMSGERVKLSWRSERACGDVPEDIEVPLDTLEPTLADQCRGHSPCFDVLAISAPAALPFQKCARVIAAAHRATGASPVPFYVTTPAPVYQRNGHSRDARRTEPSRSCGVPVACDKQQFRVLLDQARARLFTCFADARRRNPGLAGRFAVHGEWNQSGEPQVRVIRTKADVEDSWNGALLTSIDDEQFLSCAKAAYELRAEPHACEGAEYTLANDLPPRS